MEALEQLSIASVSASIAFSNAGLGAEHALAHSLGGHFDMAHGSVHPILLPTVMRFNLDSCVDKMADIGRIILGGQRGSDRDTALAGIDNLVEFYSSFKIPMRLRDEVGESGHDVLEPIARMAINDACMLTNPRPVSGRQMMEICEEVW